MLDPMYLRSRRPENAVSVLTSAIAANMNIQLGLLHSIQEPPSNSRNLGNVYPTHPVFLAANIRANIHQSAACWPKSSEPTPQHAAAVPAFSFSFWTNPFSTPWTNGDWPSIFFSPPPASRQRDASGQEQSRMETEYCDNQEKRKNDGTLKARLGVPTGLLNVILDPEENTITATKAKVWFDDQRLVFQKPPTSTTVGAERAGCEPGWKLSEIRRAAVAEARRAQPIAPLASLISTQSSEDAVDDSAHPQLFHSCMLIDWFQDRTPHSPSNTILSSSKPICVSEDASSIVDSQYFHEPHTDPSSRILSAPTVTSDPSFITWPRSELHCRPRPLLKQPPIGTPALHRSFHMKDKNMAVPLGPEPHSWNEETSDSESDEYNNDNNDDDDDSDSDDSDAIEDKEFEERGLHAESTKSPRSNSTTSSFDTDQDPLQCIRTRIYNAEQTSRLELVVIEQLLQRLSTQIRHEDSESAAFFWAWP